MADENKFFSLEYCKLDRASRLLGCEISDLLHLAEIGAIQLCLKTNGFDTVLYQTFETEEAAKNFEQHLHDVYNELESTKSMIYTFELGSANPLTVNEKIITSCNAWGVYMMYRLHGLWCVNDINISDDEIEIDIADFDGDTIFGLLSKHQSIKILKELLCFSPSDDEKNDRSASLDYADAITRGSISFEVEDFFYKDEDTVSEALSILAQREEMVEISISDFWITRKQIQKIINAAGNPMPSWLNDGVSKIASLTSEPSKNVHGNTIKNAQKREQILKAAIYCKTKFPDQCKTYRKWAKTIDEKACLFWEDGAPPLELRSIEQLISEALKTRN